MVAGIGLVHADRAIPENPERFNSDRMLGAALGLATWLSFGGGGRAEHTMVAGERQSLKHVTLVPHRGAGQEALCLVVAERRRRHTVRRIGW